MPRVVLTLVLLLLIQANAAVAGPWGTPANGLRCRITLLPDTLLEGDYLKLVAEIAYEPPPGTSSQLLNRERLDAACVVHLRNRATGSRHERRIEVYSPGGPGFGSCGEYAFDPLTQALLPDTFSVRLLNPGGDVVVPGKYDVWVDFAKQGLADLPDRLKLEYGEIFWSGAITSPLVELSVRTHPRDEVGIWTNNRICMGHDEDGCFWSWDIRDSTEIRYRPRPGHGVGRKYDVFTRGESGELTWTGGGRVGQSWKTIPGPDSRVARRRRVWSST